VWRVLLVDDSPLVRNSMQAALQPFGLEIEHAENGEIAVAKAMASHWDLIFLDVVMPLMDGPTALREIRERGNTTPVVLVTSVSTATVVSGAVKLGNVYYIAKPFTPAHIRAIATKLLKLDPSAPPPRVLLQHADPALPATLRRLLPPHVALDTAQSLAESVDIAESVYEDLVILESRELADELGAIANVLRRTLPAAGILAMSEDATAASLWQPDEGLDGYLPHNLDAAIASSYLVPIFLRPLMMLDRKVIRVAGYHGAPAHLPAYVAMLARRLVERCKELEHTAELEIDLQTIPADPDAAILLIHHVDQALRVGGRAPSFRLERRLRAVIQGRLERVVILL